MISFSAKVKKEVCSRSSNSRHCSIAEILALINTIGKIKTSFNKIHIKIQFESLYIASKYYNLLRNTFDVKPEISVKINSNNKKMKNFLLLITKDHEVKKILYATGIIEGEEALILNRTCCKRAYIQTAFLLSGAICNPQKTYHVEFVHQDYNICFQLLNIINFFDLNSKIVTRKDNFVVYLKEGEQIADLLNIMEAHVALMHWENIRIVKDVRNNLNRVVNCETANINKIVNASVKQFEDIKYIEKNKGLSYLSEPLEEVARLRLMYSELSLKEIGQKLSPPVGKSGVNHRFRKISEIAENLRGGLI